MGWFRKSHDAHWHLPAEEIRKFYDRPISLIEEIQDELDQHSNFLEYAKQIARKPDDNLEALGNAVEFYLKIICKIFILMAMLREISDDIESLVLTKKASLIALDASTKSHEAIFDFIDDVKGKFKSDLIELGVRNSFAKKLIKSAWREAKKIQTKGIKSIEAAREGANEWDWVNSSSWPEGNTVDYNASFQVVINTMTGELQLSREDKPRKSNSTREHVSPRRFPTKAELEAMNKAGISTPRLSRTKAEIEAMTSARQRNIQNPKGDVQ